MEMHVRSLAFGNGFCLHVNLGVRLKLPLLGKGKVFFSHCLYIPAGSTTPPEERAMVSQTSSRPMPRGLVSLPLCFWSLALPSLLPILTH